MAMRKPKLKPKPSRKIIGLLTWFERCHSYLCFRGSKPPEDWEEIDTDYESARDGLLDYVASLELKIRELESK